MAANTIKPKSRLDRKRLRQFSGSSISSVATCQKRWAPAARHAKEEHDLGAGEQPGNGDPEPGKRVEDREPGLGRPAEFERGRFQPEQRVVLAVLMGVDGVVADGPGDGAGIEHGRGPFEPPEHRGVADERAPVEGKAEHGLRPVR